MERKPWQRRDGESRVAYDAFCHYYRLPVRGRSLDAAYRAGAKQGENRDGKIAPSHWAAWSSKHEWVARAAAYDEHLAEQDRLQWEERRRRLRERDWEQADQLRQVVADALPHANQFVRRQTTTVRGNAAAGIPDREIVTLQFDITALARVLTDASKLQRLAADEPTERVQLTGAALDAYIAAQLARLADSGEAGDGGAAGSDEVVGEGGFGDALIP